MGAIKGSSVDTRDESYYWKVSIVLKAIHRKKVPERVRWRPKHGKECHHIPSEGIMDTAKIPQWRLSQESATLRERKGELA